jgi:adenine-specific DNA-methyltransferase
MIETEKLDGASLDVGAEKRRDLLQLFPEAAAEGGMVDFDRLRSALGDVVEAGKERYGLTWPGKAECFKTIQSPSMATLLPAPGKSVNFDSTENLIIEGDNLEVLKLLQKSYLGKVKMIYIDPPYNTGNDFIYPDDYSESLQTYLEYTGQMDAEGRRFGTNPEADGRFHSKWLNMMYPRLYLARNLLREDGIIFVSIDDTESSNLRAIMNDVYGEENFIASVVWKHTEQSKNDEPYFSRHYNLLIVYRKSDQLDELRLSRTDEHNTAYSNPDNDPRGPWRSGDVRSPNFRATLRYSVPTPNGGSIESPPNGWRWKKEALLQKLSTGEIKFSADEKRLIRKIYLSGQHGRTPENVWLGENVGTTRIANAELKSLFPEFDEPPFDTAKPVALIKRMIELAAKDPGDLVLDFFAGSGTTAQGVLDSNAHDGRGRKFILVQLPELTDHKEFPTIADLCEERVRRVIRRLNSEDANKLKLAEGAGQDIGFRVFELAESNVKEWDATIAHDVSALEEQLSLKVDHLRNDRGDLDILYEVVLKSGYPLSAAVRAETIEGKGLYSVSDGAFLICLERDLGMGLIRAIAHRKPERVLFLDEGFAGNDQLKANAFQTFKAKDIVFRTL